MIAFSEHYMFRQASVDDVEQAVKVMRKLRGETTEMKVPILGHMKT